MSTRPTDLPIWATDGGAQVTEPTTPEKEAGHVGGDPFFGDYANWWQNLVYQWAQYLNDPDGGEFLHGTRTIKVIAGTCQTNGTILNATSDFGKVELDVTTEYIFCPVTIPKGARLIGIGGKAQDNATGTTLVQFQVMYRTVGNFSTFTDSGDIVATDGSGAVQTVFDSSLADLPKVFGDGVGEAASAMIKVSVSAAHLCTIAEIHYTYDRPA